MGLSENSDNSIGDKKAWLFSCLDLLGELFVLNLIYVLFSLPIVTIGASTTALYSEAIKIATHSNGPVWSGFVKSFKTNFKRATILEGLILLYAVVLFAQYMLVIMDDGILGNIYLVVFFITMAVGILTISFLFPLLARYEDRLAGTIKNAFLLSVSNLGACIKIVALWGGFIGLSIIYPKLFLMTWFLWLLLLFALVSYLVSRIALNVFSRIESREQVDDNSQ